MKLSIIAAMAQNRVIGKDNQLPWHLPQDLQHFKSVTSGKPIIMGRKTFTSIGRALPNRKNIVISSKSDFVAPGAVVVNSIAAAIAAAEPATEAMIIGGANLYQQMLDKVDCLYLTVIDHDFEGDAYFPEFDMQAWQEVERQSFAATDRFHYSFHFLKLVRKSVAIFTL